MKPRQNSYQCNIYIIYVIDTITDFLIKLGMKPCLHLVKISIFSLNNVTVRPTKIMNRINKKLDTFLENKVLLKK